MADGFEALIERVRAALVPASKPVQQEDLARLADLCEDLALRYSALSRFVAGVPGALHPGRHSALERDTNPASAAFFDCLVRLMRARQEFAKHESEISHFACQCCALPTLTKDPTGDSFETRPICHWEQERIGDPAFETSGPNGMSLVEARQRFDRRVRSKLLDLS